MFINAKHTARVAGPTSQILVFIRTSPFLQTIQCSRSLVVPLRRPTADTAAITIAAVQGLGPLMVERVRRVRSMVDAELARGAVDAATGKSSATIGVE